MINPEQHGDSSPTANEESMDLEGKKQRLRESYSRAEEESLRRLAKDDAFWERISPKNVDFLIEKEDELIAAQAELDSYKKKAPSDYEDEVVDRGTERVSEFDAKIIERGKEIIENAPQTFISIDIEADGIAGYGSMLSIGAVSPSGEKFYSEIRPTSDEFLEAQRGFTESHGLERERLLAEAPDDATVMRNFADWVQRVVHDNNDRKPVFVAFNAAFDWSFVDLYFKRNKIDNPFGIAPFDLKSIALGLEIDNDFDWDKTKKANLPGSIVPDEEFTHNALDDAVFQQTLMYGLAALSQEDSEQTSD